MRHPEYNTVVRSVAGKPELRRVTEVREWRVEKALDADGFVISVVSASGEAQSFLVALTDAQDMATCWCRKASRG